MNRNQFDDAKLNSPGQEKIREIVSALPDDSLSMAWRSSLNEQLRQAATASVKRRRFVLLMRPAVGLAAASALAVVAMLQTGGMQSDPPTVANGTLEAALVQDHRHNVAISDVVGTGVHPLETRPTASYVTDVTSWSEVDLDSL